MHKGHGGAGWGHLEAEQRARLAVVDAWWDLLGRPVGLRLADIGCGPGLFAARFAELGARVLAVDVRPEALARVPRREGLAVLEHDLQAAPLPVPVDVAVLADVLHHVADAPALLRNLRGARRVLVAETLRPSQGAPRLAVGRVEALLRDAGFLPTRVVADGGQATVVATVA